MCHWSVEQHEDTEGIGAQAGECCLSEMLARLIRLGVCSRQAPGSHWAAWLPSSQVYGSLPAVR